LSLKKAKKAVDLMSNRRPNKRKKAMPVGKSCMLASCCECRVFKSLFP